MTNSTPFGPLQGLRCIEMGQLLAGPFCGQLLADFGCEVIKIEQPGVGDPMRAWGREKSGGLSLWWPVVARNKKSITLNARVEEGQAIIRTLARDADFLIENFRPGTLERWGLGYDELNKINPRLIMVRISGYGQYGPYSQKAGYAAIGEAVGGLRYCVGDPSTPPSRTGISLGDSLAGTFACLGAMMALNQRNTSGKGQIVDATIYESVLAVMESLISDYDATGFIRERTGSYLPRIAPSNVYPTKDGIGFIIAANQDTVFARLAEAMGRPELTVDERYRDHNARGENQFELDELIGQWSTTKTAEELQEIIDAHAVPGGLMYRAPEMLADAHFKAREAIVTVAHDALGAIKMQNVFPKLSATPGRVDHVGPALGEHNEQVYKELAGLSDEQLADYASRGII